MQSWDVRNPRRALRRHRRANSTQHLARGGAGSITPGGECEPGAALEPLDKEAAKKLERPLVSVGHFRMSSLNSFYCNKSPKPPVRTV